MIPVVEGTTQDRGDAEKWKSLDPRTIWASSLLTFALLLGLGTPIGVALLLAEVSVGWMLAWICGGVLLGTTVIAIGETVRIAVTRYRFDEFRIERRIQLIGSFRTALALERVGNVEIAADLVQGRFGLAEVRLASGDTSGTRFTLAAVRREHAEELRRLLLAGREEKSSEALAVIDWAWLRYAVITFWTPLLGLSAFGITMQVADWFSVAPTVVRSVLGFVDVYSLPAVLAVFGLLTLLIGGAGTLAVFAEGWWGYRVRLLDDRSIELRRGLLIGRTTAFDRRRIRGVSLREPPGLRGVRAARLDVIAVGIIGGSGDGTDDQQSTALVPAAPREVGTRVAEAVLGVLLPVDFDRHPASARRRRLYRAGFVTVGSGVIAVASVFVFPSLWWLSLAFCSIAGLLSFWSAVDNARGLGHRISSRHVAIRKGSFLRRTDVLNRDGILGWKVRRSPLQRRLGLVTLVATCAGGSGAYRLPDVAAAQVVDIVATAGSVWDHLRVRGDAPPSGPRDTGR